VVSVFSDDQPVSEITATELGRTVSSVLDRVAKGERLVVTRGGRVAALIVSLQDGVEVMLAGSEQFAALRREAREELEAGIAEALAKWRAGIGST
jgi:prevent-host-death family protein